MRKNQSKEIGYRKSDVENRRQRYKAEGGEARAGTAMQCKDQK